MKDLFILLIIIAAFASCKKGRNTIDKDNSVICFDTTSLPLSINDIPQSVFFLNVKDGFISGATGGIYKTTDSAKTWVTLNSTVNIPVYNLFFINAQTGFAVGGQISCSGTGCISPGGFILRTLDGGQTWSRVYTPTEKIEITSVYFINTSTGFCVGNNIILKTMDGGQTWSEYKVNALSRQLRQILFINTQVGYAVGLSGQIVKTGDGGVTWTVQGPYSNAGYYAIAAANGAMYASGQEKILKSINNGISWSELPNSPTGIFALHFISDQKGFAFGSGNYSGGDFGYTYGAIYCTDNGGITWNGSPDVRVMGPIQAVSFPTNNFGYALSRNRIIRLTLK